MHELASRELFNKQTKSLVRIAAMRDWSVFTIEFPIIDVGFSAPNNDIRIRMTCNDWNALPPSIEFFNFSGEYLLTIRKDPKGVFNKSNHPRTGRPFICMVGSLEYHTHPSHTADLWSGHKGKPGNDLGGILTQVWNAWKNIRG